MSRYNCGGSIGEEITGVPHCTTFIAPELLRILESCCLATDALHNITVEGTRKRWQQSRTVPHGSKYVRLKQGTISSQIFMITYSKFSTKTVEILPGNRPWDLSQQKNQPRCCTSGTGEGVRFLLPNWPTRHPSSIEFGAGDSLPDTKRMELIH
jgi:hypothetical protein